MVKLHHHAAACRSRKLRQRSHRRLELIERHAVTGQGRGEQRRAPLPQFGRHVIHGDVRAVVHAKAHEAGQRQRISQGRLVPRVKAAGMSQRGPDHARFDGLQWG